MHRIVDDIREDVMFLSYGIFRGETIKHKAFLEDFFKKNLIIHQIRLFQLRAAE